MDKELTPEQEDYISDGAYDEKKLMEEEEKKHKTIPINQESFDQILINIGRKKKKIYFKEVKNEIR